MFPVPARVLFPAVVSLVSGLWAIHEWHSHAVLARVPEVEVDLDAVREAQAAAADREERRLRLAEAREARLARREAQGDGGAAG